MAVTYLDLVDTDEIRALLGADDKDLSDTQIAAYDPATELRGVLLDWLPSYEDVITEGTGGSPTTAQELKYLKLKVYSKNFLSWIVAQSSQNFMIQKFSDGSNELQRYNMSQDKLIASLKARFDSAKSELLELIDTSDVSTYSQFGLASRSYDPVVNE